MKATPNPESGLAEMATTEPERVYMACKNCHGTGGPPGFFDEELQRWQYPICGSCGGKGWGWSWLWPD